jgi:hypothetical protein
MHRPLFIAAFVLLLALMPVSAQHGGGHGSAGGHGGFGAHGSFGGHMGAGHATIGMHSGSNFMSRPSFRGSFNRRGLFNRPLTSRSFNRSGVGLRIRTRGFRDNCRRFGCGLGFGFPWSGAFDPNWWWDSGASSDQDQQDQIGLANQMNEQSLEDQRMRQQGDPDVYARSAPPLPHQEARTEVVPATVLVFRDQRKQEVQNYAIVGQTLWIFSPERTQKVPLADVDIDATQKANADRGVDFRAPGADAGQ